METAGKQKVKAVLRDGKTIVYVLQNKKRKKHKLF